MDANTSLVTIVGLLCLTFVLWCAIDKIDLVLEKMSSSQDLKENLDDEHTDEDIWKIGPPPEIGVYEASRDMERGRFRHWDGELWSDCWFKQDKVEHRIKALQRRQPDAPDAPPILWLRSIED